MYKLGRDFWWISRRGSECFWSDAGVRGLAIRDSMFGACTKVDAGKVRTREGWSLLWNKSIFLNLEMIFLYSTTILRSSSEPCYR